MNKTARKNYLAALKLAATLRREFQAYPKNADLYSMRRRNELRTEILDLIRIAQTLRINAAALPNFGDL